MHAPLRTLLTLSATASVLLGAAPELARASRYDSRALRSGMHGRDVKQLQRYLTRAGRRVSTDGDFGPRTVRALLATEKGLELRADGIATRREQRLIRRAVTSPGTGGAKYIRRPPASKVVPGAVGRIDASGFAVPPRSAPASVKQVIAAGNAIAKTPYKWGGGHGSWSDSGYDCSGSVSYALHGGGLLDQTLVSGAFAKWGESGTGRWITVYSNSGHVYMLVAGLRFDTSAQSRTGSRWTAEPRTSGGFAATHPAGL